MDSSPQDTSIHETASSVVEPNLPNVEQDGKSEDQYQSGDAIRIQNIDTSRDLGIPHLSFEDILERTRENLERCEARDRRLNSLQDALCSMIEMVQSWDAKYFT